MVVKLLESPKICIEVTLFLFNCQLTAAAKTQYLGLKWKKNFAWIDLHPVVQNIFTQKCRVYADPDSISCKTLFQCMTS